MNEFFNLNLKFLVKFGVESKNIYSQFNEQPGPISNREIKGQEKETNKKRRNQSLEIILENGQINSRPNLEKARINISPQSGVFETKGNNLEGIITK